jgi:hypothetical protein
VSLNIIKFLKINYIKMNNDVQSLLLVTSFLAIGGLGLYWYKTNQEENEEYYHDLSDEESDFDVKSMESDFDNLSQNSNTYDEEPEPEPIKNKKNKTKNNRKNSGTKKKH